MSSVPHEVLAAYGWHGSSRKLGQGLINDTFQLEDEHGAIVAVVQRLHPVFTAEVNLDLDAVTQRLAGCGLETPRLLRTVAGRAWVTHEGRTWRALSYVPGWTSERVPSCGAARSAGVLVGRFHRALDGFDHVYANVRSGVHDTQGHLQKLARLVDARGGEFPRATALAGDIQRAFTQLPTLPAGLPRRHTHGDLKISNVVFEPNSTAARCLIDLDTCARQSMAYELGDMLRSWCNVASEDCEQPELSLDLLVAALTGYTEGAAGLLQAEERESILLGMQTVCIELAARFCVDAFEQCYFGWDATRFSSRQEHNLVRGRGQLALGQTVSQESAGIRSQLAALWG